MNGKTAVKALAAVAGCGAAAVVAHDIYRCIKIKPMPEKCPGETPGNDIHELLMFFEHPELAAEKGVIINGDYILNALIPVRDYVKARYDCQDFRMQTVCRLLYLYGDKIEEISPDAYSVMKNIFITAKYWMTEPGDDSACYWSENHQLLYAVWEYLAGMKWPNEVFVNDSRTGAEHAEHARKRIYHWTEHRFLYGYSEFNSTNYYMFNLGPASNFIQFCDSSDSMLAERLKMCMDLLFCDMAMNMFEHTCVSPTGRAYIYNLVSGNDRLRALTDYIWSGDEKALTNCGHMIINFVSMYRARRPDGEPYYTVPEVIRKIGEDTSEEIIKTSHGINTNELEEKGLIGQSDGQIMAQFGMEAFTNPEVINNTITYIKRNGMLTNNFLNYFKVLDMTALKASSVKRKISELEPMPNGIAICRADIYTLRTPYFCLSSVQGYNPGCFGAQQLLSNCRMKGGATVFTAHPSGDMTEKSIKGVPGYWAGFGRSAHTVQSGRIQLHVHHLPRSRGFLELNKPVQYTHTLFPEALFDKCIIDGKYAFATANGAHIALIGAGIFRFREFDELSASELKGGIEADSTKRFDLMQFGVNQFTIYELSDENAESFEAFIARIKNNSVSFDGSHLCYSSGGNDYSLAYGADFTVNAVTQSQHFGRYNSRYAKAPREPKTVRFECGESSLELDFTSNSRILSD